jgi:DNA-binding GntR family transcriptional regulator
MGSQRIAAMIEADIAFHDAVYAASRNPLIGESAGRHWHHIRRVIGAALQTAAVRAPVWDEHQAILEAINAGDAERAERLARRHCEDAGRALGPGLTGRARTA